MAKKRSKQSELQAVLNDYEVEDVFRESAERTDEELQDAGHLIIEFERHRRRGHSFAIEGFRS